MVVNPDLCNTFVIAMPAVLAHHTSEVSIEVLPGCLPSAKQHSFLLMPQTGHTDLEGGGNPGPGMCHPDSPIT